MRLPFSFKPLNHIFPHSEHDVTYVCRTSHLRFLPLLRPFLTQSDWNSCFKIHVSFFIHGLTDILYHTFMNRNGQSIPNPMTTKLRFDGLYPHGVFQPNFIMSYSMQNKLSDRDGGFSWTCLACKCETFLSSQCFFKL